MWGKEDPGPPDPHHPFRLCPLRFMASGGRANLALAFHLLKRDEMRELITTALAAADAAAAIHRDWAGRIGSDQAAEKTASSDFVTRVDLEAQEAALERIRADFPQHRILAEEGDDPDGHLEGDGDGPVWVVDPLDGTTNFLHGHPAYCASVGVVVEGAPIVGAVVAPVTGERWWAARGEGAYRNGSTIQVSSTRDLRHALIGTGFPFKLLHALPTFQRQLAAVLPATSGIRRCGSAALDLCTLAQGALDAFWELELSPWDVVGGLAILHEAGGISARIDGAPLDPLLRGSVLAANSPELMASLGRLLAEQEPGMPAQEEGRPT